MPSDRIEVLRLEVDQILRDQTDDAERRCGFVHLYGVAQAAALLALKRGLDVDLAIAAGMLHDIATYASGDANDHAIRSARMAHPILEAAGAWLPTEIEAICTAISHHSDKAGAHAALDELLKDADVLQHWLYNPGLRPEAVGSPREQRLQNMLQILALR